MSREPAYIRDFKEFTRGDLTFMDLPILELEMYGQKNDRATAVILGSIVESSLVHLLKGILRPDLNSDARRILFDYEGPIGTFSAKTALAFALGLIGPISKHDLDLIRLLRNEFAHSRRSFSFETKVAANVCLQLQTPNTPDFYIPHGYLSAAAEHGMTRADDPTFPRTRYIATCHALAYRILQRAENTKGFAGLIENMPHAPP
jgi:hypothetical protein